MTLRTEKTLEVAQRAIGIEVTENAMDLPGGQTVVPAENQESFQK